MDKLELFNEVIKLAKPIQEEVVEAASLDQPLNEVGVDSLDIIMMVIYFSEVYGITEETAKDFQFTTPGEMLDLFEKHATKHSKTIAEALNK